MCSSSIDTIINTTSGYLECGLGWFGGGLGCFGVVWGVSTDRKIISRFSRCALRPALGAFLRDMGGKIAGIPQCRALGTFFLSFFLLILARSNFDHYARECNFGILKKKQKQNKKNKNKTKKTKKSFGCVFN